MRRPDRFPRSPVQEEKADNSPGSFKADLRPEPGGFFIPRDPGVFLFFRLPGLPGFHHQEISVLFPGDPGQSVAADQQAQPGNVAFPDVLRVRRHFRGASGQHRAPGNRVPGEFHRPAQLVRPDPVFAVSGFPVSLPRLMVELPQRIQPGGRKIVVRSQRRRGPSRNRGFVRDLFRHIPEHRI